MAHIFPKKKKRKKEKKAKLGTDDDDDDDDDDGDDSVPFIYETVGKSESSTFWISSFKLERRACPYESRMRDVDYRNRFFSNYIPVLSDAVYPPRQYVDYPTPFPEGLVTHYPKDDDDLETQRAYQRHGHIDGFPHYCVKASFLPTAKCHAMARDSRGVRIFSKEREKLGQHQFPCVCPEASFYLKVDLFFWPYRNVINRDRNYTLVIKCQSALEFCRVIFEEKEVRAKINSLPPSDPHRNLLRKRFYTDHKGVTSYKKSIECCEGDRYDDFPRGPGNERRNLITAEVESFRTFILSRFSHKAYHVCSFSPWSPMNWVFKSIGYYQIPHPTNPHMPPLRKFLTYRLALFSNPAFVRPKSKTCPYIQQFFSLDDSERPARHWVAQKTGRRLWRDCSCPRFASAPPDFAPNPDPSDLNQIGLRDLDFAPE